MSENVDKKPGYIDSILPYITGPLAMLVPPAFIFIGVVAASPPEIHASAPSMLELKVENVIGGQTLDKFYQRGTERLYMEIDGKPAIDYFRALEN
ncbi:MAG: hypothetical protein CMH61_00500 [Nanoarchaeota archaeon]|nr:hypothetical protein [Nanoarchaeota archaeon]|tara:strand:+ start:4058 stop:4342 length:285 start_codon:yes stop_codon:yes gene_type:complete